MYEDIVICELDHIDDLNREQCNPKEITIGTARDDGILITLLLDNQENRRLVYADSEKQIDFFVEVIPNDKTEFMEKYDIQTGVIVELKDNEEVCKLLIGSNGEHFHYFTNIPSVNNTTDFGDTIFLNFPHTIEAYTFNDTDDKKVLK